MKVTYFAGWFAATSASTALSLLSAIIYKAGLIALGWPVAAAITWYAAIVCMVLALAASIYCLVEANAGRL